MQNIKTNALVTKANNASIYPVKLDCSSFILLHKESIWLAKRRQLVLFNVISSF